MILSLRMSIFLSFLISNCVISSPVAESGDFDYGAAPESAGSGIDKWYAEIEAERQRVARQLDYSAVSNEQEFNLRSSRSNSTSADALASILGVYDEEEDEYIDQLAPNTKSKGGMKSKGAGQPDSLSSSGSVSYESESNERGGKLHLTAEIGSHSQEDGFLHTSEIHSLEQGPRLTLTDSHSEEHDHSHEHDDHSLEHDHSLESSHTDSHESFADIHLNPEAVEDYHHSDNSHDGFYVPLNIHSCKRVGDSCSDNHVCCSHYCSWTRGFTCYSVPLMSPF